MSCTVTSTADWLRAGGIGVGAWAVIAVAVKAAADAGTRHPHRRIADPDEQQAAAIPPRPLFPPSTARHAGPAAAYESRLLTEGHRPWN